MEHSKHNPRLSILPFALLQLGICVGLQFGWIPAQDAWRFGIPILWPFLSLLSFRRPRERAQFKAHTGLIVIALAVTAIAEFLGQNYGLYGAHYHYIDGAWDSHLRPWIPLVVPMLWLAGIYPLTLCAGALTASSGRRTLIVATGMLLWDLILDPLSVRDGKWAWTSGHALFGSVPVENFLAWWTGVAILHQCYEYARRRFKWALPSQASAIWMYVLLLISTIAGRSVGN